MGKRPAFLLSALAIALSSFSYSALSYDGQINFKGKVVEQTCKLNTGSTTTPLTVNLPHVSKDSLKSGQSAGLTPFAISLQGCTANSSAPNGSNLVYAYFEPSTTTNYSTGNLTNTATSSKADNVEIQLLNANGTTAIKLGQDAQNQQVTAETIGANTDIVLRYNAQYVAQGGDATAGDVEATVNYTIAYQ